MGKESLGRKSKIRVALLLAELADISKECLAVTQAVYSREYREKILQYHKLAVKNMESLYTAGRQHYSKAAVFIGILLSSLMITRTAYATYNYWVSSVMVDCQTHSSIQYEIPEGTRILTYLEEKYVPGYVPEGYELVQTSGYDSADAAVCSVRYEKQDVGSISYWQTIVASETERINTENASVEEVFINHLTGYYIDNPALEFKLLIWYDEAYQYVIYSNQLTKEEMVEIATSIRRYTEDN